MGDEHNVGDQKKVAKKNEKAKAELKLEMEDLTWLLKDVRSRRTMYRILDFCRTFQTSFSFNSNEMAFNEGQRNVGLFIRAKILEASEETTDFYAMMIAENRGDKNG